MRTTSQAITDFLSFFLAAFCLLPILLAEGGCIHRPGRPGDMVLTYRGPASTICVCGTMNGWSRSTDCMHRHNDHWDLELSLPPGRYAYVLVIDGRMQTDPAAVLQEDDGFGTRNSILVVP